MKKEFLLLTSLLLALNVNAQITFQKTIGGTGDNQGMCIQQTTDGGYILAGKTNNFGLGYTDFIIIKTDVNGDTVWTKEMGSTGIENILSVRQTTDGGYIFAGVYAPPPSTTHAFLMKTTANGTVQWSKAYGNSFTQDARCVQQTSDGGYIFCGNIVGTSGTSNDYLLLKTNSSGVISWAKNFGYNSSEYAYYVEQTNDGGYIFCGFGATAFELIKTNANGNFSWCKSYGSGTAKCLQQTTDGGFIVAGYVYSSASGSDDILLKKTDGLGNLQWAYRYGGTGSERSHNVKQTSDGGYILSGTTTIAGISQLLLIKTDATGVALWSKVYGNSGFCEHTSVEQTSDGGYIVLGKDGSTTNNSMLLVKTDANGNSGCNQADTLVQGYIDYTLATNFSYTANLISVGNPVPTLTTIGIPSNVLFNIPCFSNAIDEQNLNQNAISLFPNPTADIFTVTFNDKILSGNVQLINCMGENVHMETFSNASFVEINPIGIADGIYFVKVSGYNENYSRKIIIQRN